MKLLVLAASLALAAATFPGDNSHYKDGDRYVWFPDGDNMPVLADLYQEEPQGDPINVMRRGANNEYYLYTRANPTTPQQLYLGDTSGLLNSNFDPNKVTKLIIHGWRSSRTSSVNTLIWPAFLEEGDYNVIVVDWSHTAGSLYLTCVSNLANIGSYVGQFLQYLNQNGAAYSNMHLVGFSLGAHISGVAGRFVGGQIGRITGLDPAGPLMPGNNNRLVPSDAIFVEVIHTDAGFLGFWDPCGDIDFYPNGGHSQPGCWLSTCHHSRAYEYYAATVKYNNFIGNECSSVSEATSKSCSGSLSEYMGNAFLKKDTRGIFRMETSRTYPYSV